MPHCRRNSLACVNKVQVGDHAATQARAAAACDASAAEHTPKPHPAARQARLDVQVGDEAVAQARVAAARAPAARQQRPRGRMQARRAGGHVQPVGQQEGVERAQAGAGDARLLPGIVFTSSSVPVVVATPPWHRLCSQHPHLYRL